MCCSRAGNPKRAHLKKSATAGSQFKVSMGALLKSLSQKTARFIRCIKPNELKQQKKFEYALVQHQVRYLGSVS
jgi:myosin heavy subunit